ncbi:hypothetical protein PG997_014035 [Apiospora hydei]|uniref:Uncharacterized protein n=1 Tax=Apiospora hydei TaxID=1337664 RepID=A0ABR1V7X1_9PEZI
MSSESTFLGLPREIRDLIYREYVTLEHGYVYNPATNQLKAGGPIHQPNLMALQSCCKQFAHEMDGLALRHNIVRFYTICSIETKHRANALFCLMKNMYSTEAELLHQARGRISPEAKQRMASRFPQFLHLIERFDVRPIVQEPDDGYGWTIVALPWEALRYMDTNQYGEALSVYRDFVTYALQSVLDTNPPGNLDQTWLSRASRVLGMCHEPWRIPEDDDDVARRRQLLYREFPTPWDTGFYYRFSVAAACIRFLRSVPDVRSHMRQVVLEEDRPSVPFAECHAQGLLPFLRETPKMHVTRRVNLWRNILQYTETNDPDRACARSSRRLLCKMQITPAIARWVVEHLDLPEESFTLILDGDPVPQLSAQIFHESVSRDLQWSRARAEAILRGLVPDDEFKDNDYDQGWRREYRRFPQAMADIIAGRTSLIRCNFHPGYLGDPEEIIEIWRGIPKRDPFLPVDDPIYSWQSEWYSAWEKDTGDTDISPEEARIWGSYPIYYQTVGPLPDWSDLAMENGNNLDDGFLSASPSGDDWDSQDWTLEFA